MRFAFESEQEALAEAVARLLEKESSPAAMRRLWDDETGRSARVWQGLVEIGLPGVLVPEKYSGAGGDLLDLVLALGEIGRSCVPDALLESLVVGPMALALAGSDQQRSTWLPDVAAGTKRLAVALHGLGSVPDVHVADALIFATGDGLAIARTDDLSFRPLATVDPARRQFAVTVPAEGLEPLPGGIAAVEEVRAYEATGSAAVLLGLADHLLDSTVDYAKMRHQFGRPIGSFQAVKHQLAGAAAMVRTAHLAVEAAAWRLASGATDAAHAGRLARICAVDAEFEANRVALQIHGGIGFTWEYDLQMWLKRGKALEQAHGGRHDLTLEAGRDVVAAQLR